MRRDDRIRHGKRSRHGRHDVDSVAKLRTPESSRLTDAPELTVILFAPLPKSGRHPGNSHRDRLSRQAPMRAIKGSVLGGFKSSAPFLRPRIRLVSYPVGGIRIVLELIDLFNRPIRPFDLDCPTLTVTKYYEEN
jgi:hypothetical protein